MRTLWSYWQLRDVERVEAIEAEARELRTVRRHALAFHTPDRLQQEIAQFTEFVTPRPSSASVRESAARIIAAAQAYGWLPTPEAPEAPASPPSE